MESYAFSLKQTMDDEKIKDKIDAADRQQVQSKADEVLQWLASNGSAEKPELEAKKKELESVCNPVMQRLYARGEQPPADEPPADGPPADGPTAGPKVEEVD